GNTSDAVAEGKITLSWKPWQKTVCNPSCTSSSTGLTYKIFRFVEPMRQSLLGSNTPWAVTGGTNNPFASDKPIDPLAIDSSGNPIYTSSTTDGKLIATISNCDSSNLSNCTFEDSTSAGTGFSTLMLYNYEILTSDAAGNAITARTQRYRSPFFTGNTSATSSFASFRIEPRLRRAGVFLVDEAYQQAQTRPQIMAHVPMDISGLDHDFFIQKYEASVYGGGVSNASPVAAASNWPLQGPSSAWVSNAGLCYHKFLLTGSFDLTGCGDGTQVNSTTATFQSKQGTAPQVSIDQGASWKGCRNTGISNANGASYYLSLPSDAEWSKAADWGDVNQDGTIDQNTFTGSVSIPGLESGTADTTTVRCHTDNNPGSAYASNSSQTANCRSRYGVADMVGNVWEWTTGQQFSTAGYDNGTDGLWYGVTFPGANNNISAFKMDLLRAFPSSSSQSTVADNADFYWYATSLRGAFRGGSWDGGSNAGRWALYVSYAPSNVYAGIGGRCSL
ncbi:MAG: SUMF1/EgtB/PvdO family nonheme iron enzyme, partial [Oligoflexus sp.]|nr:SUMF1/EgtB/PvdO family nonheme iron enzyme [Oligoflexus sp.]